MIVIGIDPSFTRTGVSVCEFTESSFSVLDKYSISIPDDLKKAAHGKSVRSKSDVYDLENTVRSSRWLANIIGKYIDYCKSRFGCVDALAVEYPALATRSGAYLGFIQQAIYDEVISRFEGELSVVALTPTATKSLTKYTTKSELVIWCKSNFDLSHLKSVNHDEATAMVLSYLFKEVYYKRYKKTYKVYL